MCNCNNLKCKFCGSNRVNKRDKQKYNGKQRYLCRDCGKIWTEGNDERVKYTQEQRERVYKLYLENMGIRSIERIEGISNVLILKWIRSMGKKIKEKLNNGINEIKNNIDKIDENNIKKENIKVLEIDEIVTYVKKNLKTLKEKKGTLPTYGLLLIGTEIKLLDLKSETEQKEHIESYLKK